MRILCFGSLNIDKVYQVDHILLPGETLTADEVQEHCGGKGINQSIALARAGAPVWHAGQVGQDGGMFLEAAKEAGVHTDYLKMIEGLSGHAIIQVDRSGQNNILLYSGANRKITKEFADEVLANFGSGDILLLQNEISNLDYIIDKAYERGMRIALNPSPFDDRLKACDMSKISIFLLNEVEAAQLTGLVYQSGNEEQLLESIASAYPGAMIVLTLGSQGSICKDGEKICRQEIFKVEAVDTTAAGDTFTGYFLTSLAEGRDLAECLRLAAKASAIAVTRPGAVPSIPVREEVLAAEL